MLLQPGPRGTDPSRCRRRRRHCRLGRIRLSSGVRIESPARIPSSCRRSLEKCRSGCRHRIRRGSCPRGGALRRCRSERIETWRYLWEIVSLAAATRAGVCKGDLAVWIGVFDTNSIKSLSLKRESRFHLSSFFMMMQEAAREGQAIRRHPRMESI